MTNHFKASYDANAKNLYLHDLAAAAIGSVRGCYCVRLIHSLSDAAKQQFLRVMLGQQGVWAAVTGGNMAD